MNAPFDNPLRMLRQLKGAPLSVYLACQIVRQVVSRDWLCEQTGYSDNAVTRALGYLTEHNYLARVTGGWMIAAGAIQLPLMAALPAPDGEGDDLDLEKRDYRAFENKKREKRVFPSSSSTIFKAPTIEEEQEEEEENPKNAKNALLAILDMYEVREPTRSKLAKLHHVTPEFIRGHIDGALAEGNSLGTAIHRIEYNWPLSAKRSDSQMPMTGEDAAKILRGGS